MILILFIICIFLWRLSDYLFYRQCPPGPLRLPIFGNYLQVKATSPKLAESLKILAKKYGDIMSIRLGSTDYVVLSDNKIMKEVLTRPELTSRDDSVVHIRNMKKNLGTVWSNGKKWKALKEFTVKAFRDFGFSRSNQLEIVIQEELEKLMDVIRENITKENSSNGGIIEMKPLLEISILNLLWKFLTAEQFSYSDSNILEILSYCNTLIKYMAVGRLEQIFPVIRDYFPNWSGRNEEMDLNERIFRFLSEQIAKHEEKIKENDAENYVELFLQNMRNEAADYDQTFTTENLKVALLDFIQAGTVGTSGTLNFAIFYLMLHPDVQSKMKDEIAEKIPKNARPTLTDRARMPYTEATIMEIFRLGNIFPIPTPRKVLQDFWYKGFLFKKGTLVLSNFHSIVSNENIWGDPEYFRPGRFLKNSGELDRQMCEEVAVFGEGGRRCIGAHLAKSFIFLFLVSFLQQATFLTEDGEIYGNKNKDHNYGWAMSPHPYKVRICFNGD